VSLLSEAAGIGDLKHLHIYCVVCPNSRGVESLHNSDVTACTGSISGRSKVEAILIRIGVMLDQELGNNEIFSYCGETERSAEPVIHRVNISARLENPAYCVDGSAEHCVM
jgi:hypothetical protein